MADRLRADARIGTFERILHLKRLPMLRELPAELLGVVAEQLEERLFAPGDPLLRAGDPEPAIHFLVDGTVAVSREGRSLSRCGQGAALGGLGVLAREPARIDAVAESHVLSLGLEPDAVQEIFEDHFTLYSHVLRETGRQLLELLLAYPQATRGLPVPRWPDLGPRDLDLVERILLLRTVEVFRRASVNALAELSRGLTEIHFEPGMELWRAGEASGFFLLLVSGRADCQVEGGEGFSFGPGTPLGSIESVAERPRWFRAVTATPLICLHGNIEGLRDVLEDNAEMAGDYLAVIASAALRILDGRFAAGDAAHARGLVGYGEPLAVPGADTPPASG